MLATLLLLLEAARIFIAAFRKLKAIKKRQRSKVLPTLELTPAAASLPAAAEENCLPAIAADSAAAEETSSPVVIVAAAESCSPAATEAVKESSLTEVAEAEETFSLATIVVVSGATEETCSSAVIPAETAAAEESCSQAAAVSIVTEETFPQAAASVAAKKSTLELFQPWSGSLTQSSTRVDEEIVMDRLTRRHSLNFNGMFKPLSKAITVGLKEG